MLNSFKSMIHPSSSWDCLNSLKKKKQTSALGAVEEHFAPTLKHRLNQYLRFVVAVFNISIYTSSRVTKPFSAGFHLKQFMQNLTWLDFWRLLSFMAEHRLRSWHRIHFSDAFACTNVCDCRKSRVLIANHLLDRLKFCIIPVRESCVSTQSRLLQMLLLR